ncbi:MAG TPA: hypothetical protein VGO00_28425 [Kofleriaceae bacterium]|nr:hypothetical protein [Kofleriaceae bacterium]
MSVTEWDQRQLCPDGSCTGLIGADGLCKVCGRVAPNWGEERKRGLDATVDDDLDEDEDDDDDDDYDNEDGDDHEDGDDDDDEEPDDREAGVESTKAVSATPKAKPDWQERKLCTDGSCIGVIGDDGACRVCGNKAES